MRWWTWCDLRAVVIWELLQRLSRPGWGSRCASSPSGSSPRVPIAAIGTEWMTTASRTRWAYRRSERVGGVQRRAAGWLAVAVFAVSACAAAPADEPAGGLSGVPAGVGVASAGGGVVVVGRQDSVAARRLAEQPPSESSGAGHLGRAEPLEGTGAAPSGMQRRLGRWDLPGPLLRFGSAVPGRDYVVLDRCEHPELQSEWQAAGGWGALVPEFGMTAWTRRFVERDLARCATHRFEIVDDAGDRDPRFFSEREAAERWLERQHASLARRYSVAGSQTVRDGSFVAGFVDSASPVQGGPLGIMFAPVDAPVDEVRVLPWSVHVSDGALRGLVRNWSRHLWAYDVTITADDRTFVWPLSVQPGETAPFEIGGWQGPSDRESVDVRVTSKSNAKPTITRPPQPQHNSGLTTKRRAAPIWGCCGMAASLAQGR